jgi:hypothetical protein
MKYNDKHYDDKLKEIVELIKYYGIILEKESIRGSAIICATFVEESLSIIIKAKLAPPIKKNDELFDGAYSPLGTFSAKIDLAYRLGLIDAKDRSSFHIIRKIRNEFAHSLNEMTFESEVIVNLVKELFELNKRLLHLFGNLAKDIYKIKNELPVEEESTPGSDFIFKALGLKRVYELIGAILASVTQTLCPVIIKIDPYIRK